MLRLPKALPLTISRKSTTYPCPPGLLPTPHALWPFLTALLITLLILTKPLSVLAAEAPAQRIVVLYAAFTEILEALGQEKRIVARTKSDTNACVQTLPVIGTHMRPNIESIVALKPDLVLQLAGRSEASLQSEALRKQGLRVVELELDSFADLMLAAKRLGELTDAKARAQKLSEIWQRKLDGIRSRHSGTPLRVFFEVRSPNLLAAGQKNIVSEIIAIAGGVNVIVTKKKLVRLSEEELLALDPDVYLMQQGPMNPSPQPLAARKNLASLRAAHNGQSLVVPEEDFSRPGPKAIEACDRLERWLHAAH
ncbi:MAG: ABC transporter substrate-binding protein [Desulfovibrio sp.]|nr:ABC transporter substrate-binding protein [Desulfovibrio sp.]